MYPLPKKKAYWSNYNTMIITSPRENYMQKSNSKSKCAYISLFSILESLLKLMFYLGSV